MTLAAIGSWTPTDTNPAFTPGPLMAAVQRFREPAYVVQNGNAVGIGLGGQLGAQGLPLLATLPALYPEWLGDRSFNEVHGTRFPYSSGAMANGIATTAIVREMSQAGFMGFFGAAGLTADRVSKALDELEGLSTPWGSNLIHSPNEPDLEQQIVDLYLARRVRRVSAAAYMALTPMVVQYAYTGIRQNPDGSIHRDNFLFAKISRPEVARRFMEPAPAEMLDRLVAQGRLTAAEGQLARRLPVAEDYTIEADSGGHTDNQSLTSLFPIICRLRDEVVAARGYVRPIRLGAAGGLGTPSAVAAAYALGAAYVLTGSVNQGAVESGLAPEGRAMLATADLADVIMAPAADMFELGVKVQVLRRGTMFGVRALKLYEVYHQYQRWEDVPAAERGKIEKTMLRTSFEEAWASTESFFARRDPRENERANRDPHHKMALVFRSYLGQSSKWAIAGDQSRRPDYQIWCGPAMGAFNSWVKGTFLEPAENRTVVQIARNLMEGAATVTRAQQLRSYGVPVPAAAFDYRPRPLE